MYSIRLGDDISKLRIFQRHYGECGTNYEIVLWYDFVAGKFSQSIYV